jgi:hypothetical protein
MRRALLVLALTLGALGAAGPAGASQLIDRNASHVKLEVNSQGMALVTYVAHGKRVHLLAWNAINARFRPARPGLPQVRFRLDYSGGWGSFHRLVWKHFANVCQPYDGPALALEVTACTAPDGSYWALQSWQTALPDLGFAPWLLRQKQWWLHLSHWSGDPAELDVYQDWVYSRHFRELFGQLTYRGVGVRGFGTTRYGNPTDTYGRLVYVDTHNSKYGKGWRRENSFVASGPPGLFCYGFFPHDPYLNGYAHPRGVKHGKRGPGVGDLYRVTAVGPGVTPDLVWQAPALHAYSAADPADVSLENAMNAKLDQIRAGWHKCLHH